MPQKERFMDTFLAAWDKDNTEENKRSGRYNKEAWMYVQNKIEEYFRKISNERV